MIKNAINSINMNIRKFLVSLSLALSALPVIAQSEGNVIDEVIWIVGDEAILRSEVEQMRLESLQKGVRWDGDPYCSIAEELAIQKLFLHQAAIDSVEVSDADVFQSVDERINEIIMDAGSKEKMEEWLGMTSYQIRERLYSMKKNEETVRKVKSSLVENIKVTPAQVRRYFKEVPEDSIPFVPTKVEVQIFTQAPVIPQEEIDRVKNDLRSYTDKVNSGTMDFGMLARMYSEDGSKDAGGELGFMGRGMLVPEFANVAFNLTDTKTVSKIVESEYGFHIIQLIEKRGDQVNVRHILRKPRVSAEALQNCINTLDSVLVELNNKQYTFEECAKFSSDKDTRNNYGLMVNKNMYSSDYGTPKFEMKDLPVEVARSISGLEVGEISKPFIMLNSKGKEVVAIVKLKSRVNGHRATMEDDYQVMQEVVTEKLSEKKIEEWIREKQKTTYVRINENWKNCEFKYPGWIK